MDSVDFAFAEKHIEELVARATAGETIAIVRNGKAAALIVPPAPDAEASSAGRKIDVDALEALAARLPRQDVSSVDLIREGRDGGW